MSRATIRSTCDICADCNAAEPGWASINRGVFICHECCSIHRSLGRHISQVKSLKRGSWSSSQLSMVHELVSMGANSIWEHSLMDPSQGKHGRRKPNPRDPIHPTKADFIRAKYQFLAFVNKNRDSEVSSSEDLSKQLHSSVRTGNVLTSLRLLSLGADPNFFHPERGNSPLHVAAGEGQALQVELLVVYGADPGAFDSQGKTPMDHARKEGHIDLVDRLLECQFELTDRLAFYLCNRKPDHRGGQHFIIPEMADSSLDMSELAKAARKKLQALPNNYFEELAKDVYDEVDRRENESIVWQANQTQSHTSMVGDSSQAVPFLPVNPEFTSTRNQGRQKLARFNKREFATLIIDILSDAKRRQQQGVRSSTTSQTVLKEKGERAIIKPRRSLVKTSSLSDDEPLYDSVASDEDYASIGDNQSIKEEKLEKISDKSEKAEQVDLHTICPLKRCSSPTSMISFTESIASSGMSEEPITLEEYLEVKHRLAESQSQRVQMVQANKDLRQEITLLQNMVQRLIQENELLRSGDATANNHHIANGQDGDSLLRSATGRQGNRPQSMFEPRDSQKHHQQHWSKLQPPIKEEMEKIKTGEENRTVLSATAEAKAHLQLRHQGNLSNDSEYDNTNAVEPSSSRSSGGRSDSSQVTPTNTSHSPPLESTLVALGAMAADESGESLVMPVQEDVVRKTERITKKIQELLISAQEGKLDTYINCSEKIVIAVTDMAALFPKNLEDKKILSPLEQLTSGSARLQEQCATPTSQIVDIHFHIQDVIQCAYDIAKAAKQLVMQFE